MIKSRSEIAPSTQVSLLQTADYYDEDDDHPNSDINEVSGNSDSGSPAENLGSWNHFLISLMFRKNTRCRSVSTS